MPLDDPYSSSTTSSYLYTCNSKVTELTTADLGCKEQKISERSHSIVTLSQWLFPGPSASSHSDIIHAAGTKQEFETHSSPLPMVDLRPSQEYEQKCISNSSNGTNAHNHYCKRVVVNLPFESLMNGERSFELPPRNIPFAILVPSKYYSRKNSTLSIDLDQILFNFFYATKSKATKKSRIRWNIPQLLLDHESLWADARRLGVLQNHEHFEETTIFPQPRLWEPDAMVRNCLLPLLEKEFSFYFAAMMNAPVEVWDLGCGSGRDICFLAESLIQYPIHFVGIDNHLGSSCRCIPFWERRLFHQQQNRLVTTSTTKINLNKISSFQECFTTSASKGALKMIYCVRYINRKLFHTVANSSCLPTGFVFAVTHFCKETEGSEWNYEHPSEAHVLERNELKKLFLPRWIILRDSISYDTDHGRPMIQFIASAL